MITPDTAERRNYWQTQAKLKVWADQNTGRLLLSRVLLVEHRILDQKCRMLDKYQRLQQSCCSTKHLFKKCPKMLWYFCTFICCYLIQDQHWICYFEGHRAFFCFFRNTIISLIHLPRGAVPPSNRCVIEGRIWPFDPVNHIWSLQKGSDL